MFERIDVPIVATRSGVYSEVDLETTFVTSFGLIDVTSSKVYGSNREP
jgi:hypothetical protein